MIYYTNEKAREEIDALLKENARLEATLGKDSTPEEKEKVRRKQSKLFRFIKEIDQEFYERVTGNAIISKQETMEGTKYFHLGSQITKDEYNEFEIAYKK